MNNVSSDKSSAVFRLSQYIYQYNEKNYWEIGYFIFVKRIYGNRRCIKLAKNILLTMDVVFGVVIEWRCNLCKVKMGEIRRY